MSDTMHRFREDKILRGVGIEEEWGKVGDGNWLIDQVGWGSPDAGSAIAMVVLFVTGSRDPTSSS